MAQLVIMYETDVLTTLVLNDVSAKYGVAVEELEVCFAAERAIVSRKDGKDLKATVVAVDSQQEELIEILAISPQCRTGFRGEWLKPAQLTKPEVDELLDRLPCGMARKYMNNLLVLNNNNPTGIRTGQNQVIHHATRGSLGGKYLRIARGRDRAGNFASQLWEVIPKNI